ncbi:hypothetical protein [Teredinibacter turnerae]|uniref:hypothetical protein n=1 Tax=Teredinibacter turnerae TaxID=2426 RepID=UPI00035D5CAC|nr:hypothetical protein [Teredinibacter turnerae]
MRNKVDSAEADSAEANSAEEKQPREEPNNLGTVMQRLRGQLQNLGSPLPTRLNKLLIDDAGMTELSRLPSALQMQTLETNSHALNTSVTELALTETAMLEALLASASTESMPTPTPPGFTPSDIAGASTRSHSSTVNGVRQNPQLGENSLAHKYAAPAQLTSAFGNGFSQQGIAAPTSGISSRPLAPQYLAKWIEQLLNEAANPPTEQGVNAQRTPIAEARENSNKNRENNAPSGANTAPVFAHRGREEFKHIKQQHSENAHLAKLQLFQDPKQDLKQHQNTANTLEKKVNKHPAHSQQRSAFDKTALESPLLNGTSTPQDFDHTHNKFAATGLVLLQQLVATANQSTIDSAAVATKRALNQSDNQAHLPAQVASLHEWHSREPGYEPTAVNSQYATPRKQNNPSPFAAGEQNAAADLNEPDPQRIAQLVNEALVEQALLNGVDLS